MSFSSEVGGLSAIHVNNIDEAWETWYKKIRTIAEMQDTAESRDGAVVGEILNAVTVIEDPTRCILMSPIRRLPMRYLVGELLWYLSGSNKLSAIQLYTNAWDRMSDDGYTVNSNYGERIQKAVDEAEWREEFDQYEMVKELLKRDPLSRQAIIHIKQARNLIAHPTKDVNCTVCLQFFIRSKERPNKKLKPEQEKDYQPKLFMTTYMRSNDLWMGFPNDVFQFTAIQIKLAMELGVGLGTYTHMAGSLHLYERDYEVACKREESMNG